MARARRPVPLRSACEGTVRRFYCSCSGPASRGRLAIWEPIDQGPKHGPAAGSGVFLRERAPQVPRAGSSGRSSLANMCSDGPWRSLMDCHHLSRSAADGATSLSRLLRCYFMPICALTCLLARGQVCRFRNRSRTAVKYLLEKAVMLSFVRGSKWPALCECDGDLFRRPRGCRLPLMEPKVVDLIARYIICDASR